ncbi:hypothetical protein CEQ90_19165 [Lewinellaceae bacterium SD302]|nr:hypothetical protein CEQ90_19165 [Lewinellaceae bacterium SD302]
MRHPGLQPLWKGLQREWQQQQVVAVALLLIGIGLLAITAVKMSLWYGLAGSVAATLSLLWLLRLSQRKPVSELYHLLEEEPGRVRRVYAEVTERLPFGLKFSSMTLIYFVLDNGEIISVPLRSSKIKLVSKTLNRVLPEAEFGRPATL